MHRITVICDDTEEPEPYRIMEYRFHNIKDMEEVLHKLTYSSDFVRGYELVPVTVKSRRDPGSIWRGSTNEG